MFRKEKNFLALSTSSASWPPQFPCQFAAVTFPFTLPLVLLPHTLEEQVPFPWKTHYFATESSSDTSHAASSKAFSETVSEEHRNLASEWMHEVVIDSRVKVEKSQKLNLKFYQSLMPHTQLECQFFWERLSNTPFLQAFPANFNHVIVEIKDLI